MSDAKQEPTGSGHRTRRWLVGGTVGVVAALAVGAGVIALPLLSPAESASTPTAAPTAAPSPTPAPTTPSPEPTPTPTCTVTASDLVWTDIRALDLPSDGRVTSTRVQRIEGIRSGPVTTPDAFPIDDDLIGIITSVGEEASREAHLAVIDRTSGSLVWSLLVDGYVWVISTPASTGVDNQLIIAAYDSGSGGYRMISYDPGTGELIHERETGELYLRPASAWRANDAEVAPAAASGFFVSDRDALFWIDAITLEPQWSVSGEQFDEPWFEGGVAFAVTSDVVFVGSHALDARTGEALGWESDGWAFEAAGATFSVPLLYDHIGPYTISGLDTTTGERCWSREILDVAATAGTLWLLLADGTLAEVDPFTGQTIAELATTGATSITALGLHNVIASERIDPGDDFSGRRYTLYGSGAGGGPVELPNGDRLHFSNGQVVALDRGTVKDPAKLYGYDFPTATPVWEIDGEGISLSAGVVLRTTWDAAQKRIDVELLQ